MCKSLARSSTARWSIQFVRRTIGRPSASRMSSSIASLASSSLTVFTTMSSALLTMLLITSFID